MCGVRDVRRRNGALTSHQIIVKTATTGTTITSQSTMPSFSVGSRTVQPSSASGQLTIRYHTSQNGTTPGIPSSTFNRNGVHQYLAIPLRQIGRAHV